MTTPTIKTATIADEASAIAVVTLAFGADPAARWTWPNPQQYLEHFSTFVKTFAGKAFTCESAYYTQGFSGVALWLPPQVHPEEEELQTLLQRTASISAQKDLSAVFEQMSRYHPQEPHWFLPFIGVDPSHQGEGLGSALLRHSLVRCDRDGEVAYLESSNPKNIPLYERHGFELLGTIQVGSSPPIFPMIRKPR